MYWDHYGMGWSWIWVLLPILLVAAAIVVVIVLVTRSTSGSSHPQGPRPPEYRAGPPPSSARAIVEERLARGEITPDEYREIVRALDETSRPPGG